jgi:hypothetical protein
MLSTVLSCELSQTVFHWRAHTPRTFAVCCVNAPGDATRRTRRDHTAKLQNRVIERERAAYEHLEGQLRNYSGELEVALTAHQEALGQIEALEAARKQEELAKENLLRDKDDWLRAQPCAGAACARIGSSRRRGYQKASKTELVAAEFGQSLHA